MQNVKRGGRPPKVTREEIAYAALKVGLDRATVRNIAEELGVTSMTIYRYFNRIEDIVDVSIKIMMDNVTDALDDLDTFEETLGDAAKKYFQIICENYIIIFRLVQGNIFPRATALCMDTLISYGVQRGLTASEAFFSLRCVMQAAAGCAVTNIGRSGAIFTGSNQTLIEAWNPGVTTGLIHLNSALTARPMETVDPLEGVTVTLLGLRTMFGERMTKPASGLGAAIAECSQSR